MELRGHLSFGLTAFAFAWCAAMIALAFVLPVSSSGETIIAYEDDPVLVWIAAPSLLVLCAWVGLHAACARGSRAGLRLGESLTFVLWLFVLVTGFSIGMAYIPAALALLIAISIIPVPAAATAGRCGRAA